jgi:hypothetical protein
MATTPHVQTAQASRSMVHFVWPRVKHPGYALYLSMAVGSLPVAVASGL